MNHRKEEENALCMHAGIAPAPGVRLMGVTPTVNEAMVVAANPSDQCCPQPPTPVSG